MVISYHITEPLVQISPVVLKSWLVPTGSKNTTPTYYISRTPILFNGARCSAEEVHFPTSLCLSLAKEVKWKCGGCIQKVLWSGRWAPFVFPSFRLPDAWNLRCDFWSSSSYLEPWGDLASESQSSMADRKKVGTWFLSTLLLFPAFIIKSFKIRFSFNRKQNKNFKVVA